MTKSQTIRALAAQSGQPRKTIVAFFAALFDLARSQARHTFTVPGFGKLSLRDRRARIGRNPRTGEPVKIPAKRVVKFRLAKTLKDAVLATSA